MRLVRGHTLFCIIYSLFFRGFFTFLVLSVHVFCTFFCCRSFSASTNFCQRSNIVVFLVYVLNRIIKWIPYNTTFRCVRTNRPAVIRITLFWFLHRFRFLLLECFFHQIPSSIKHPQNRHRQQYLAMQSGCHRSIRKAPDNRLQGCQNAAVSAAWYLLHKATARVRH